MKSFSRVTYDFLVRLKDYHKKGELCVKIQAAKKVANSLPIVYLKAPSVEKSV